MKEGKHYTKSNLEWYEIGVAAAMPARSMRFNAGAAASVAAKVVSLPKFITHSTHSVNFSPNVY
jgi:hypothetical protein